MVLAKMIPLYHTTTALLLRIACMPLPFLLVGCVPSIPPLPGASTGQSCGLGNSRYYQQAKLKKSMGVSHLVRYNLDLDRQLFSRK